MANQVKGTSTLAAMASWGCSSAFLPMRPEMARPIVRHCAAKDSRPLLTMIGTPSQRPISFQAL